MTTGPRSAIPAFLLAGVALVVTVATGVGWLGEPFRLVHLVTIIGMGMFTGVSWTHAMLQAQQRRGGQA